MPVSGNQRLSQKSHHRTLLHFPDNPEGGQEIELKMRGGSAIQKCLPDSFPHSSNCQNDPPRVDVC